MIDGRLNTQCFTTNSSGIELRDRQVDGAPLGVVAGDILAEDAAEIKSAPRSDGGVDLRITFGDDLQRRLLVLVTVRAADVEVIPVLGDAIPEVGFGAEGFSIEELVLDETVNGFDVALPGVGLAQFVGVAGEDDTADGVLEAGQAQTHHLRPVMGHIVEVFGVGRELAEELPVQDIPRF